MPKENSSSPLKIPWALLIALLTFMEAFLLAQKPGITCDEPYYLLGGIRIMDWFRNLGPSSFSLEGIQSGWNMTIEHPPLAKIGFGFFNLVFGDLFGLVLSARIFPCLLFGLLNGFLFHFLSPLYGKKTAFLAVLMNASMPRLLGYSCLCMLDFPLCFFWVTASMTFYFGFKNRALFAASSLLFSAANLTKFNAIFMLLPLFISAPLGGMKKTLLRALILVFSASVLFIAGWPWLYHDTFARLENYLVNKTSRVVTEKAHFKEVATQGFVQKLPSRVPEYYLGSVYKGNHYPAPWHYAPVIFFTTLPLFVLVFLFPGIFHILKTKDPFGLFCLIQIASTVGLLMLPFMPRYGGTRFILQAYPFTAVAAALGAKWILDTPPFKNKRRSGLFLLALLLFICYPAYRFRECPGAYYNLLAGGIKGAEKSGLPFENLAVDDETLNYINEKTPEGGKVFIGPIEPFILGLYQSLKTFGKGITLAETPETADTVALLNNKAFFDEELERVFKLPEADKEIRIGDVPLCRIFIKK